MNERTTGKLKEDGGREEEGSLKTKGNKGGRIQEERKVQRGIGGREKQRKIIVELH